MADVVVRRRTGYLPRRALLAPVAAVLVASLTGLGAAARNLLPTRPLPSGTSASRCAQCGATGHGMLDRRCPAAPKVIA